MCPDTHGSQPTILRCSRCGMFVDWEHARLQIICQCRPYVDLPPVIVREATDEDRVATLDLFQRDFGHTKIVAFGEVMRLDDAPAFVADMKGELAGALAYRLRGSAVQIVALATDPMWQRSGVGARLIAEVEQVARRLQIKKIVLATTNDNLPSLYFYQRHGYRITEVVQDALLSDSGNPVGKGFAGIPPRDEVRLEKVLS
jgi:ribosomal protein S18 acetylase RimI-like enzyme